MADQLSERLRGAKMRAVKMTPDEVRKKAKEEGAVLYEYEYDKPLKIRPAQEVLSMVLGIRNIVVQNKQLHPDWKSTEHKQYIHTNHSNLAELSNTHKTIWNAITHPDTTEQDFGRIRKMIDTLAKTQAGKLQKKEADALVSSFLINDFTLGKGQETTNWTVENRPG